MATVVIAREIRRSGLTAEVTINALIVNEELAVDVLRELVCSVDREFRVRPPTRKFRPEEIDPFRGKVARAVLKKLDAICARLPETEPGTKFGSPMWRVGKKTFVSTHYYTGRLKLSFWVGAR